MRSLRLRLRLRFELVLEYFVLGSKLGELYGQLLGRDRLTCCVADSVRRDGSCAGARLTDAGGRVVVGGF
jgi:hypothetical protein